MKLSDHVIELLYDRHEGWWSMEELARTSQASAGRLDRALAELGRRGQQVEFSPATGIRLRRPPAVDAHLIERNLGVRRVGRHVICFSVVDSAMDIAADSARQARSDGLTVLAEAQRKGRGRLGRRWLSPPGANLLMSVLLKDPRERLPTEAVTVAAGLAVAEGIERASDRRITCRLKWPNDVRIDGKKVAGVLVEQRRRAGKRILVVGVGVNVNARPPSSDVTHPATSLAEHMGEKLDRIPVAREILCRLDRWVLGLTTAQDRAAAELRTCWAERCDMLNRRHTIGSAGRRHTGRVVEIDPLKGLTLLTDVGGHVHIPARTATVM